MPLVSWSRVVGFSRHCRWLVSSLELDWCEHAKRGVTALAVVKISRYSKMALGVPPPHAWVRVGSGTLEAERLPRKTRPEIRPVRNGNRTLPMGTIMAGIPRRVRPVSTDEQDVAAQRDALEAVGLRGVQAPLRTCHRLPVPSPS